MGMVAGREQFLQGGEQNSRLNYPSRFLFADVFMASYNSMMVIALKGT